MAWTNAVILNSTRSLTKSLALALWRAQRSLSKQTFWPSPGQSMTTYENYWKLLHLFTKHGTKTLALGQHSASISFPAPRLTQHNRHEKLITLARSMQVTLLWMMQWRSKRRMNQIWMTRPGLALYIHGLLMDEDCRCCIKKYLSQRPVSQKQVEYGRSDVVVHILFRFHLVVRRKLPLFPASTHWVHSSSLTWWWGWAKEYLARDQFLPISWEFGFKNLEHGQWPLLPWFHVSRSDKSLALRHLLHFALHCISEGVWSIGHSKFAFAVGSWTLCCTLCWWVPLFLCSFVPLSSHLARVWQRYSWCLLRFRSIEAELRAHRDLISQEVEALQVTVVMYSFARLNPMWWILGDTHQTGTACGISSLRSVWTDVS